MLCMVRYCNVTLDTIVVPDCSPCLDQHLLLEMTAAMASHLYTSSPVRPVMFVVTGCFLLFGSTLTR